MSANTSYAPTAATSMLNGASLTATPFDQPQDLDAYTRMMFQHTQKQMDVASRAARRSSEASSTSSNTQRDGKRGGSISSVDSQRS